MLYSSMMARALPIYAKASINDQRISYLRQNHKESEGVGLIDKGAVGERKAADHARSASIDRSKSGKRAKRARFWSAIIISMIVVPMIVVVGFYATSPARSAGPATVVLGTAGNFVILAKTGISTTGATSIVGDIGISPAAATYITGFGLIMDGSGHYSTSSLVNGRVYASDYANPTPATMTQAISDMETAYTNAAGRTNPNGTELYAGLLAGQTFVPGLYKWSSAVSVSAAGVTLDGGAADVWIFQIAGTLDLASGAHVNLIGGAVASNVFWQVADQVTLGTTSSMKGTILCQTAIVMQTGATLEGRALAQTAVTTDANIVVPPGTMVPEFSQVLIPFVGTVFVVAMIGAIRNQRKKQVL